MPFDTRHVFFFLPRQELFDEFFDYVQNSQFDVAADAFSTFRVRRAATGRACSK
jgi:hypothetical protein